jgi:hippurate hydrolase
LINSERETQHATAAARAIVGDSNVDEVMERIAGAEDFAWMLREKPGAYIMIGGGDHDVACTSLHNPHYDFPDAILSTGADYWVRLVRDRLPANS